MRTTARLFISAGLAVATIGLTAPGAYAGDPESLEVFPSTAAPGATVTANTTACGEEGQGVGDARSLGAGEFRMSPGSHKESVVGQFLVPHGVQAGAYGVSVRCANGKRVTGEVTLRHRDGESASYSNKNEGEESGSHDSGGNSSGDSSGHSSGASDHGSGGYEENDSGGQQHHQQPSGHVQTGVGGSVAPDTDRMAAGVAVLVAAGAGGTLLLRRRASGAQGS
ncbi:hypothetical protein [Streptomyces sp. NPDC001985]|uniref:hypothetical protein n=1 Tax=Streptomyces sp. NPDC001985 TaxID=3154406 RepID=UPI003321BF7F